MSNEDVEACRQLIEHHLQNLVESKGDVEESSVTETECAELVEGLRQIFTRGDEPPSNLSLYSTDAALRDLLFDLISATSISDVSFVRVWYLLDIATILGNHNVCEPASNFSLIENLLDSQTVSGCRRVFDYLESRREKLTEKYFEKKNLIILRCCNELLRRLSRAEDTVFCGRVFIYLFQTFPLGDKSSVNLRGEFHVENTTHFDPSPRRSDDALKPMDVDVEGGAPTPSGAQTPSSFSADPDGSQKAGRSTPIPGKFKNAPPDLEKLFPQFWSLQGLFSQPTRLFEPAAMSQFKEGMAATLSCFKSLSTHATGPAPSTDRGVKRKRDESEGSKVSQPYNPKYLTNRDLFDLEVHDVAFRRHILTQCLIMIEFLLSLTPASKGKAEKRNTDKLPNRSVAYDFTLSEEDAKYCQTARQSIAGYLQQQGPGNDGKFYYRVVDTVLSRDKNWASWKAESCPPIRRDGVEVKTFISAQESLCQVTEKKAFANPPGANDFDFLSQAEPLEALENPSSRERVPTLEDYYNQIEGFKLDEDFATDEEKKELQEQMQSSLWRALRTSALTGRRFELCEKIKDGANTKALIGVEEAPAEVEPEPKPQEQDKPSTNGHVEATEEDNPAGEGSAPQTDASQPLKTEDKDSATEPMATDNGGDDSEFAPPGAMEVDEEGVPSAEVQDTADVESETPAADDVPVQVAPSAETEE